jgi:hypothetical protein
MRRLVGRENIQKRSAQGNRRVFVISGEAGLTGEKHLLTEIQRKDLFPVLALAAINDV